MPLMLLAPVVAGGASAQSLQLPPDVDAFYSATPQEGQVVAHSADGCGWIAANSKSAIEYYAKRTWNGACYEGLALGPGDLIERDPDGELVSLQGKWALRGRFIGMSTLAIAVPKPRENLYSHTFSWMGTSYYWTRIQPGLNDQGTEVPADAPVLAGFTSLDSTKSVSYSLNTHEVVVSRETEAYRRSGAFADRLTRYPCAERCGELWAKMVSPLVETDLRIFYQAHIAEIDALEAAQDPVLQPLLKQFADKKQREAERKKTLQTANQAGKLIASPSLDKLLKQALAAKP